MTVKLKYQKDAFVFAKRTEHFLADNCDVSYQCSTGEQQLVCFFVFLEKWITIHTQRGHRIDKGVEGVGGGPGFHRGHKTTESAHETSRTNQYSFPSLQNHWAWNRFTAVMNALMNIRILGLLGYLGNVVFVQACEISKSHPNDGFSARWWFPVRLPTYDHSKCRI